MSFDLRALPHHYIIVLTVQRVIRTLLCDISFIYTLCMVSKAREVLWTPLAVQKLVNIDIFVK